jgi:methylglyoxal synthase
MKNFDGKRKKIALVAQDNKKDDLVEWLTFNSYLLSLHELYVTGTTGKIIEEVLRARNYDN